MVVMIFLVPLIREAHDIQLKSTPALSGSRLRFSQHSTFTDEVSWQRQLGTWKVRATWGPGQKSVAYPPGNPTYPVTKALVMMSFLFSNWGMLVIVSSLEGVPIFQCDSDVLLS